MVTVSLVHVDTLARHAYIMACSLHIIRGREYQQCHLYSNTVWYARTIYYPFYTVYMHVSEI